MDNSDVIKLAWKSYDSVRKKFVNKSIILFCSFAKGTNSSESDKDFTVVFKD